MTSKRRGKRRETATRSFDARNWKQDAEGSTRYRRTKKRSDDYRLRRMLMDEGE